MYWMGMQNAISIDGTDRANSWDSPVNDNFPVRNTVFWVGTLAAGSHTIKGRFASNYVGGMVTISNRVLVIITFDGDEFRYVDSATAATAPDATLINDPNAQVTFTPSAACKALILYNIANSGAAESYYGKKAAINIAGTDYAQAEKSPYYYNFADSVFTCHALSLSAVSTTVKGRFANAETADPVLVTIHRRQLAVLLLADSTLLNVITSTTQVDTDSNSLVDDTEAKISRTTSDMRELLVVAMGTKRSGTYSNAIGECYGIKVNTNDRANSRGSPESGGFADSAGTAYAERLAAGTHTVQGRFSNNRLAYTAIIDARQVVALWFVAVNIAPTNGVGSMTDMDDTNNIYAQKKLYTGSSVATDADGYADIHYMEFRLKQGATVRASFQYHEDDNTFNIQAGSTTWFLDGSSSASRSGTQITVTWKFTPQWDATEEFGLSIELYVIDAASASDVDTVQSSYVDVVTRLVTGNFATDDGRINVGGTTTISGTVYYANNPASTTSSSSYPPNAEFTSVSIHNSAHSVQATDTTIVNGAFSVSFAIPSAVQSNTYHIYINLADADGVDQDAVDGDTTVVIGDRIKITFGGIVGNTIDVDEGGKVWYQAVYEYEPSTPFTLGTLKLNGITMNWTTDRWTYDFPYEMSGSQAVFSITGVLDTQYGLTAFNNVAGNIVLNWATMEITISKP